MVLVVRDFQVGNLDHPEGRRSLLVGHDDIRVEVEVGVLSRGRVPAVEHPDATTADEGGLSATAGGNPVVHLNLQVGAGNTILCQEIEER